MANEKFHQLSGHQACVVGRRWNEPVYLKICEKLDHELALGRAHQSFIVKNKLVQLVLQSKIVQSIIAVCQQFFCYACLVTPSSKQLPAWLTCYFHKQRP